MVPVSVSVSSGITAVFLITGTKAKYNYSIALQIANLMKNEVWLIPNLLGISEKGQIFELIKRRNGKIIERENAVIALFCQPTKYYNI